MDEEHQRIVARGNEPRREQRTARSPFVVRVFGSGLFACDGGQSRRRDGCRKESRRIEPVRYGRARRSWNLLSRDRRASTGRRIILNRRTARQQRSQIQVGGIERGEPLFAQAI